MIARIVRAPREDAVSKVAHFAAYAGAFEKAFVSDDWSLVGPFFTEDALYEVALDPPMGGRFEGRAAILAYFKDVLDRFDRRFESREIALLEGPREDGESLWLRGSATYRAKGVPDFVLELEETAHLEGDRIRRLEDRYEPAMKQRISAYLKEHGRKLGISLDD
jgi:ketosteroid isomerase-like protein